MDVEHLSKSQIVLLTLLVSFVTSIATGIVTVSLMDQAPQSVAQTVNRVIERTVEKVNAGGQTAAVVTQEKTVVVKESDLIVEAVKRASPAVVRVYTDVRENPTLLGLGVVLSAEGRVVGDVAAIGNSPDVLIERADGARVRASVYARDTSTGLIYMQAATSSEDKPLQWTGIAIASQTPVLGASVVALSGRTITRIAGGIVTALMPQDEKAPQVIDTDISDGSIMYGSPLIDTNGSLVGISTSASRSSSSSGFISSPALIKDLVSAKE